ncbi:hypothetical protein SEA_POUND_155 [Mycobacterium phage Pound]|nr:hypothetical protein SEA_POUND_155 [Mycobacterium phage Pound]
MAMGDDAPLEPCLVDGCCGDRIYGSCMCRAHTMAGANPLGPDEEWTCECGGWDPWCDHDVIFDEPYLLD